MGVNEIELADLRRLAASDSPDLAAAVIAFLQQPDPTPEKAPPPSAQTLHQMLSTVSASAMRWVPKKERRERIFTAWKGFLAQPEPPLPPRFELAAMLVDVYERGSDAGRAAIMEIARVAPLRFGLWGGLKRIFKRAEQRLDAEVFGVLAWRVDHAWASNNNGEVSPGTTLYLRRRAWRFLRLLGQSVPTLYPQYAAAVLRHYGGDTNMQRAWVPMHVFAHETKKFDTRTFQARVPNDLVKQRAFDEAWKRSPDVLMDLLERCGNDLVARFAIQSLRRDFPERLRNVTPAWLARLAKRPLESAHEFLVETLQGSPELHVSKLRELGLHEAALDLLASPGAKPRAWAIEYARAHAQDLSFERLADLLASSPYNDTRAFAGGQIQSVAPRTLGVVALGRLLNYRETMPWALKQLTEGFDRAEMPEAFLRDMLYGTHAERGWFAQYMQKQWKPAELDAGFWMRALDDARQRDNHQATQTALQWLGRYPVKSLPTAWLLDGLTKPYGHGVAEWLTKADELPGLDVERVKGFALHAQYRPVALTILGNTKLVAPRALGLPWLLALARRADPSLHDFAHRYLLEHMKPADFGDGDLDAGVAKLFALALGEKEPEAVRGFAQTYLRCHHPVVGPEQPESKSYRLKPALARNHYAAATLWNALWDYRPDARRFAVTVTRADLREWTWHTRVYELAESEHREVRNVAYDAMLKAGESGADAACTLKPAELDAVRVFALTESRKRSTREVAMEVIRKHYGRLGGAERLAWLMESPDREVRLFSVRLLWERHRPRQLPPGWKPSKKNATAPPDTERFEDVAALRAFLRRVLFGLPPGRMERRDDDGPRRHIPASEAKQNVIAVLRDMGVADATFAQLVAPVLGEFTGSLARGEWQACLAALVRMRAAHPGVELGGLR